MLLTLRLPEWKPRRNRTRLPKEDAWRLLRTLQPPQVVGNLIADAGAGSQPSMGTSDPLRQHVLSKWCFVRDDGIDHCLKCGSI